MDASGKINFGKDFSLHSFLYLLHLEPSDSITYFCQIEDNVKCTSLEIELSLVVFPCFN